MDSTTKTEIALTEGGKLLAEQEAIFAAMRAEEEALMAPIRARLEALRLEAQAVRADYESKLSEALKNFTFEDLTDPFRAMEFVAVSWNGGRGVPGAHGFYRTLFGDCYIFDGENHLYDTEHGELGYIAPRVAIPAKKDSEKLARTAEKLELVHRANMEILGDRAEAKISIFDDGVSLYDTYSITFNQSTEEWVLGGRYSEQTRAKELVEILEKAPTYY